MHTFTIPGLRWQYLSKVNVLGTKRQTCLINKIVKFLRIHCNSPSINVIIWNFKECSVHFSRVPSTLLLHCFVSPSYRWILSCHNFYYCFMHPFSKNFYTIDLDMYVHCTCKLQRLRGGSLNCNSKLWNTFISN